MSELIAVLPELSKVEVEKDELKLLSLRVIVQLLSYMIVRALIPGIANDIPAGKAAPGVFLGTVAIAAGILNAACMAD